MVKATMRFLICLYRVSNSKFWNWDKCRSDIPTKSASTHFSDGQGITTSFQESPSMPTYLVAYVVSNYKFSTNTVNPNEFAYRVYANPSKIESTQLALDTGVNVINAFQEYLQVNYTMPKMDQVAVPDFLIGGTYSHQITKV